MGHFFLTVKGWALVMPEVADLMASYVVQNLIKEDSEGPRMDLAGDDMPETPKGCVDCGSYPGKTHAPECLAKFSHSTQ